MKPWVKWGLWGLGGVAAIWVAYRAFFREPDVVYEEEDVPVPLLTPSIGSTTPAGISNIPSAPGATAAYTAKDLIILQRGYDIEDRQADIDRTTARQKRQDEQSAARRARADQQAADRASQRLSQRQDTRMQSIWDDVNLGRLKEGKDPLAVCITRRGSYGVGPAQCKGATRFYGS